MPFDGQTFDKPKMSSVSSGLRWAKKYLEKYGWVSGWWEKDGAMCVLEAINEATWSVARPDAVATFVKALGTDLDQFDGYIAPWNDAPGRTVEEVYAALDKAIALADAEI